MRWLVDAWLVFEVAAWELTLQKNYYYMSYSTVNDKQLHIITYEKQDIQSNVSEHDRVLHFLVPYM
jgi:hypothetical protein